MKSTIRIGCGSGAAPDRVDAGQDVVELGNLDYVCFDTMSEKTMPWQKLRHMQDASEGYDLLLEERLRAVLPAAVERGTRIIGNFGSVNPSGAVERAAAVATDMGLSGFKIACVEGDDVMPLISPGAEIMDTDRRLSDVEGDIVAANAYVGADSIVEALDAGADLVIGGRFADASMYLGAMRHAFGWRADDWDRLGAGITLGHVIECGSLSTGGAWSEPGYRVTPGMARIGNPIVELDANADAILTKPPGTGGLVSRDNFRAHLLHEVSDPTRYLAPDVIADFTRIRFAEEEDEIVRVEWLPDAPRGRERPPMLKVLVGVLEGYMGEAMILYAGYAALEKATMFGEVARERLLDVLKLDLRDLRIDYVGVNATLGTAATPTEVPPNELMVRIAGLTSDRDAATEIARLADYGVMIGPLGMGERRKQVVPLLGVYPTLVSRDDLHMTVTMTTI